MKNKKRLATVLLSGVMACGLAACKPEVPNDDNTLEIFVMEAGYGYEWVNVLVNDFKTLDWVQAKYPNLNIPEPSHNSISTYSADKLTDPANTIDLFFGASLFDKFGKTDQNGNLYVAQLDDLYGMTVPGESVTFKDKMIDSFETQVDGHYYSMPWVGGMNGILYNETQFNTLGMEVPVTTDEFIAVLDKAKSLAGNTDGKYDKGYSVMSCTAVGYWKYMLTTWWAQYEGLTEYNHFYEGIDYRGIRSKKIFEQQGRLEALRMLEKIIKPSNGYMYPSATAISKIQFKTAQNYFLTNDGMFHVNGDWFSYEMKTSWDGFTENGMCNGTFKFLRTPVISSIIDNLPMGSIKDDVQLAKVVRAIDAGTSYQAYIQANNDGVHADDYARVAEARKIVDSLGVNHTAVIPDYASSKGLAKDFLLYMATDRAQDIYIRETKGAASPFIYNVKEKNPTLYNSLDTLQQSKFDIFNDTAYPINILPAPQSFKLVYFGGLADFTISGNMETRMFTGKEADIAQTVFNNDIAHWTDDMWNNTLVNAGM